MKANCQSDGSGESGEDQKSEPCFRFKTAFKPAFDFSQSFSEAIFSPSINPKNNGADAFA
jgi:hypothetical protein